MGLVEESVMLVRITLGNRMMLGSELKTSRCRFWMNRWMKLELWMVPLNAPTVIPFPKAAAEMGRV